MASGACGAVCAMIWAILTAVVVLAVAAMLDL